MTTKEEDEMLKYAFVPKTVQKVYAFRYRGYADEIPYLFCKHLARRKLTSMIGVPNAELHFDLAGSVDGSLTVCKKGDWIVSIDDTTQILTDEQFQEQYVRLSDLNYQN
ncbi:hypothetical protein [Ralstonia phage RSL2]|uniref:Uncharacterized protein n=1 Tax=Ralstonia phage RSL2 TaxID=1585840 RepID=A0A0A8J9D2_9CAUD|nr:hypothetical protein [Ralstonia phage RSL2]